MLHRRVLLFVAHIALTLFFSCQHASASEFDIGIGMDSRYISEGRDNTEDKSLRYLDANGQFSSISTNIWYAQSSFEDYKEFNFSISYEYPINDLISLSSGYAYIDVNLDDFTDHELSMALSIGGDFMIATNMEVIYSDDAQGIYSTIEFSHTLQVSSVEFVPYISFGFNGGYVPDEHRGLENASVGLAISGGSKVTIDAYIAEVSPVNKKTGDTLINATWAGLKLSYAF